MDRTDVYKYFVLKRKLFRKCFEVIDKKYENLLSVMDVYMDVYDGDGVLSVVCLTTDGIEFIQKISLAGIEDGDVSQKTTNELNELDEKYFKIVGERLNVAHY